MWYHFTCTVDLIDHHVIFVMVFCFCTDSRYSFVSSKTIELINTCREIIIFPSTDSCSYLYIIRHLKTWMLCCVLLSRPNSLFNYPGDHSSLLTPWIRLYLTDHGQLLLSFLFGTYAHAHNMKRFLVSCCVYVHVPNAVNGYIHIWAV